jgi:hypothetical protein
MVAPFQGGCACGAIRYEVSAEPMMVMDCHCRECQHSTGGACATSAVVAKDAFKLIKGRPKKYTSLGDSGNEVHRHFCEHCGSPLYAEPAVAPFLAVKAGSLDDPSWLKKNGALYTSAAQPWAHIDPNLLQFEKAPSGGG